MQKNSQDFSMQEALRLAKSPAGQQLLAMLQRADAEKIRQVMDQASAGDMDQAKKSISALLDTPEAKALLAQLGR